MKQILIILTLLVNHSLHAQEVWKEGTQWVVTYEDGCEDNFFLEGKTTIEGMEYINLKSVTTEKPDTSLIGYIRTERGDTVVYARFYPLFIEEEEHLLYDFGSFEAGTCVQYSERDTFDLYEVVLHTDTINGDSLCYFQNVIEPGDILPCYNDIVFKVGHLGGPMFFVILEEVEQDEPNVPVPPGPARPIRKNISHTVLKLAGREVPLSPTGVAPVTLKTANTIYYDLQGMHVISPQKGIFIKDEKKRVLK